MSLGDGLTFPQRQMDEDQESLLHRSYEDDIESV